MELICPICAEKLNIRDRQYVCARNHSFDVARQGYVNLLTVQQKHSLNPGDTREQVLSRREFLEAGFYGPIANALIETAQELGISGQILDVSCSCLLRWALKMRCCTSMAARSFLRRSEWHADWSGSVCSVTMPRSLA